MKNPTIALGYVSGPSVDQPFMNSVYRFLEMDVRSRRCALGIGFIRGLYIDDNRDDLARDFLTTPADYLLSLDSDIEFEPEVIYAMLDDVTKNDRAIEAALYFGVLHGEIKPVWFVKGEDGAVRNVGSFTTGQVIPLAAVGMGCTLIRRDVFEKLPDPWYERTPVKVGGKPVRGGEDICFCLRAGEAGFQTWGHAGVAVRHWKRIPLDFELFRLTHRK